MRTVNLLLISLIIPTLVSCVSTQTKPTFTEADLPPNIFQISNASKIEEVYLNLKELIGVKSEYETNWCRP